MGIFHRSSSSSSRFSNTFSAASEATSPRTSIDSTCSQEQERKAEKDEIPPKQEAPLLSLPIELIQQVTSYLDAESAASFCLSSRYIYYALGSDCLTEYINSSKSRFAKRKTIEAIVERAFPGHWYCAWCDIFHSWSPSSSPSNTSEITRKRECTDYNSYLSAGPNYVLRFHHVRLALNHSMYGAGIPLSAFTHTHASMAKIYRTPVPTNLSISARIVEGKFILHSSFAMILPAWSTARKNIIEHIWPALPHLLAGHRGSENGHTGLMAAVDNVVRRGWKYPFTQMCTTCATDWSVSCHFFPHASGGQTRLVVQSWRDLGDGRNPFDTAWRAHGVCVHAMGSSTDVLRTSGLQPGEVRRAFETCEVGQGEGERRAKRTVSPARTRIYQSFMGGEAGGEVRRSRARPNVWRTRSETEEIERRKEEDRIEVARQVAESLVRMSEERY
ncbi:hypothetical protein IQ06DRAFT_291583 [Phaeosphaeriaceae sp. SRC1lsM3a]|nr:hypothetical protein IQ06DRAFT_291583 [Stagonospora sp. SRC1lsM3a]